MNSYSTRSFTVMLCATLILFAFPFLSISQDEGTRAIEFPDIPGYVTLKCDLHMHTPADAKHCPFYSRSHIVRNQLIKIFKEQTIGDFATGLKSLDKTLKI